MRCPRCSKKDKIVRSYIAGKRVCTRCRIRFSLKDWTWVKVNK